MPDGFDFDFRRVGRFTLTDPDGVEISQHTSIEYAQEAALRHALANEINGEYTISAPNWSLKTMGFGVTPVPAPDRTPDTYVFNAVVDYLGFGEWVESNVVTPIGYNESTDISVSGGEYQIDSGAWVSSAGTIAPGQTVRMRVFTSLSGNTESTAQLTIGGISAVFSVTTAAGDQPPVIGTIPGPVFIAGVAAQHTLSQYVTDDGASAVTLSLAPSTLPAPFTFTPATGVLSYDGTGSPQAYNGFALTATDAVGADTSNTFAVSVTAAANDKARANSYDSAWLSGWVESARTILASVTGQNEGMMIHLGDSLTRTPHIGAWAIGGAGKTAEDIAICNWMHAGTSTADLDTLDGYYLQSPVKDSYRGYYCDITGQGGRSFTVGDGLGAWSYMNETPMPSITNKASAQAALLDCGTYSNDLNLTTILSAIQKPQFATVQVNLKFADPTTLPTDFEAMHDALEAAGIVPIVITSTYRRTYSDDPTNGTGAWMDATDIHNATLKAFAQSRGYPLIDLQAEMQARRPIATRDDQGLKDAWTQYYLSGDGVHLTDSGSGGYESTDNPYANGGDAATHATGEAMTRSGYALRGWLIVQKMKQIKALVVDDPLALPMYDTSKIVYEGYFTLPTEKSQQTGNINGLPHNGFAYPKQASAAIAFNPEGNGGQGSLFLAGAGVNNNGFNQIIGEIDIPENPATTNVPKANLIQTFALALGTWDRQKDVLGPPTDPDRPLSGNGHSISGMSCYNGKLYLSVTCVYWGDEQPYTLFVRDNLNLADAGAVRGPFAIGSWPQQRSIGMGMGNPIPDNWQPVFDGHKLFISGSGGASLDGGSSYGPTVLTCVPEELDALEDYGQAPSIGYGVFWEGLSGTTFSNNPHDYATRAQFGLPQLEPVSDYNGACDQRGTFMLPECRTVFCVGAWGNMFYDKFGDEVGGIQQPYSDGEYLHSALWMFDAQDIRDRLDRLAAGDPNEKVAMENGKKMGPYSDVQQDGDIPYTMLREKWSLKSKQNYQYYKAPDLSAGVFDPVSRRLYFYERSAASLASPPNTTFEGGALPVIHVLHFPV